MSADTSPADAGQADANQTDESVDAPFAVRLALHAFPPRWRERHDAELLTVREELSQQPNQRTTVRELGELVAGGLAVRFRDRPPLKQRAALAITFKMPDPRWHGWLHDRLTPRFAGLRQNLKVFATMVAIQAFVIVGIGGAASAAAFSALAPLLVIYLALAIGGAGFKRRQQIRIANRKLGYDITSDEWRWRSGLPLAPRDHRLPNRQLGKLLTHAPLVGRGAIAVGASLLLGAAWPNTPREIGPFGYNPDPNSPLTTSRVAVFAIVAVVGTIALGLMTRHFSTGQVAVAPMANDRKVSVVLAGVAAVGSMIGLSGLLPDLACAVVGAVMVVAAGPLLVGYHYDKVLTE